MFHVIRNQHFGRLSLTTGPVVVLCRADEDGDRLRQVLAQALGPRPLSVMPAADPLTALPDLAADSVIVPVHVVRSRFARGEDLGSRVARRLGRRRTWLADRMNQWFGARVELVCGEPVRPDDPAGITAAVLSLREDRLPPVMPTEADLWAGVQARLERALGSVPAEARSQLQRMANRYHLMSATILRGTVHYLSRRFFRGVWASGVSGLEALPAQARIVYLPCHRSHFDYMVLPYALNELGQTSPIIAAGDNLNIFAIGHLLQTGFAFFIRRTFGNDTAYRTLCAAYIGESLQAGVPLIFFPEGGRSRDGWMRSPKLGMLQMVREQLADDAPVYAVPVHVAYEACPDGKSLAKQSLGRAKRKESVFRFLKALRMLTADHGRVFVSLGEPVPLTGTAGLTEAEIKATTMAQAQQLLQRINAHAVVTSPALVAVSLIARDHEAAVATLGADSTLLAAYVEALADATGWPVMLSPEPDTVPPAIRGVYRLDGRPHHLPAMDGSTCRHALALLGLTAAHDTVTCSLPLERTMLDWHRGAIGHLLAPLGFVARHVATGGTLTAADLQMLIAHLDRARQDATLRLYWPEETPSATVLAGVTRFLSDHGFCEPLAGGYVPVPTADQTAWQRWATLAPATDAGAPEGRTVAST